jgi:hypothetical protein
MPIQTIKDPQTGQEVEVYVAPKAASSPPKPKPAPKKQEDKGLFGLGLQPTDLFPTVGVPAQALQTAVEGVKAGVQELQRTGDFNKAVTAGQKKAVQSLEGNRPIQTIGRIGYNAGRNAVQEVNDLVGYDIPAALGVRGAKSSTEYGGDAPFLGLMPALPKAKSSGPAEDLVTGIAQVAIEWLPATKVVGLVGKGLKALPGATRVAQGTKAAGDSYRAAKATQIAKLPAAAQRPAAIAAGAGEAIVSNVIGKGAATGALIDFAGFDQHGGRLYDLADNLTQQVTGTPLEIPFLDYLKSKPGDAGLSGRLKNVVEGAFVGSSVEFLMRAFRAAKYVDRLRNAAPDDVPVAAQAAKEATENLEAEMVRQGAQAQEEAVAALPPAAPLRVEPQGTVDINQPIRDPEGMVEPTAAPAGAVVEAPTTVVEATPAGAAPKAELPDTRGQGEFYHGAAKEIDQLDEGYYENANIYGQGFYVTDDLKTAGSYTKKNAKSVAKGGGTPSQVVYRVSEAQPVRFYDLDAPLAPSAKQYLEQASEWSESVARALDEVDADPSIGLAKVMDEVRANSRSAGESRDVIQEVFEGLRETLEGEGYGGFTHVGGKLTKAGREHQVRIYWNAPNQLGLEKFDPAAPTAAATEPSVPSAGTPEPAAQASPQEIQELDATLAKSMANLSPEQRVAVRDQMLAEKYGPALEPEPVPQVMEEPTGSLDEPDVEPPPVNVVTPVPDEAWSTKLVDQMLANRELLESGDVTMEDLLANNVQKLESPSGRKYQPIQPPAMVEAYRAHSDLVSRPDATGIPVMTDERIMTDTAAWLEKSNYSSKAVMENLQRLSGPLSAYRENLVALRAAALYVDHTNLQAGTTANRWLNGQMDEVADMGKLTSELVTAAAQQDRANRAFESVTRPLGQLLRSTQIPRPAPGSIPFDDAAAPVGKNIAEEMEQALIKDQEELVADTIGSRISPEAQEAILTGQYDNPKVIEEFNALALNMAQSAVTPGFSQGFWKKFNSSLNLGANGLMMYRSSQLLSSGITFWGNVINSALRTVELPLTQAAGALVTGHPVRASRSLMIYGQYVSNLANAFRMGVESFKVGRGLFDMDRSQVDFLDRLAKQDADGEMLAASPQQGEWDLNTMPWLSVQDKSNWAMAQKRLWQGLNLSTRLQVSADSAFKTLVGQSFEYVRNLQPGLDHAVRMGMDGNSKEAWKFAQDYSQAAVDRNLKDVTIDGRTILDAVMDSPHAQTATRWATFTDDIWASMETRTTTRGMELAEAKGLKGDEAMAYAQQYVEKGQKVMGMGMDDIPAFARTFSLMPQVWQSLLDSPFRPLFALIQPFNRTPGDIVKSVARKTPLAPLVDTWWRDVFSEDAMTRDRAWGDIATGAAAISLASIAMTHGRIEFTGGGPGNPDAKRKWMEQEGKQPYSFRIRTGEDENGNPVFSDWISMRALDPYASLFGGLADYQELANKVTTEARERLGSALVMDLVSAVAAGQLQKSYYQGFTEVYEMAMGLGELDISPNRRHPVARYVERLVASFVPGSSSLRAGRRLDDPIARDVPASNNPNLAMRLFEETSSEIKNMLPGYSTELPTKRNWITGDPIFLSGVWGDQFLPPESPWLSYALQFSPASPFQKKAEPGEAVLREMGRLTGRGAGFIGPRATDFTNGGKIKENRLNPYEYEQYILAVSQTPDQFGRTLLQALEEEVTSELYQSNPPGQPSEQVISFRAAALNQVIAQYLKLGRETFLDSPAGKRLAENADWAEGANRDVQFRLKYGQEIDPQSFIEGLR